jgi:glyoxylase I family protein
LQAPEKWRSLAAMIPFVIEHIDHVVLRVADVEKSLTFYVGALGCRIDKVQPDIELTQLRAGASQIDLVPTSKGGGGPLGPSRNVDHFALEIAPFDEAAIRAHLAAHGIDAGESKRRYGAKGYGPSLYIADPDGNVVELKGPPEI